VNYLEKQQNNQNAKAKQPKPNSQNQQKRTRQSVYRVGKVGGLIDAIGSRGAGEGSV